MLVCSTTNTKCIHRFQRYLWFHQALRSASTLVSSAGEHRGQQQNTHSQIVHRLPRGNCKANRFYVLKRRRLAATGHLQAKCSSVCKRASRGLLRLQRLCTVSRNLVAAKKPFIRLVRAWNSSRRPPATTSPARALLYSQ